MRQLSAALAFMALACGGGGAGGTRGDTPAPPPSGDTATAAAASVPAPPSTRAVHEVRMLATPDGQYVYQPATLYVRVGDRVRWINESGGPHNVAFYRTSVPPGAVDFLNATMANRMGDLTGKLLFELNAVYEISFEGAPPGTYGYFCTPHELLGMKAELIITR